MARERGSAGSVLGLINRPLDQKHTDSCRSTLPASRQKNAIVYESARNADGNAQLC
jgi:hypothetical protein